MLLDAASELLLLTSQLYTRAISKIQSIKEKSDVSQSFSVGECEYWPYTRRFPVNKNVIERKELFNGPILDHDGECGKVTVIRVLHVTI